MEEQVFDRVEKKYLLTNPQKKSLLHIIKKNMKKDEYHKSTVMNLYFDTNNYDLIIQSIDSHTFKEKLRARSYEGYDRVFLEIKTKLYTTDNNLGYKRRVMITHDDFDKLINHQATLTELASQSVEKTNDLQIAKEIDYLISHFDLRPMIFVSYNRESYKTDDNLRITFDERLRFRHHDLCFNKTKHDKIYFKDKPNIIMEVKAPGVIPLWLSNEMTKLGVYPRQFSKIGRIYERIIKE